MNYKLTHTIQLFCLLGVLHLSLAAQKPGGGGGAGQTGQQGGQGTQASQGTAGGGSGGGLQGLSFTPSQWPYLDLPNPQDPDVSFHRDGRVVVCYRLAKGNSATQPFVLEPIDPDDLIDSGFERPCGERSDGPLAGGDLQGEQQCKHKRRPDDPKYEDPKDDPHWTACSEFQRNPPALRANQILVVGIDISDLGEAGPDTKIELTGPNRNQLKLFNLSVTNQQGTALNPAPVRASFPLASGGGAGGGAAGTLGAYVRDDTKGPGPQWVYIGTRAPSGPHSGPIAWAPNQAYCDGAIVSDATGMDFYRLRLGRKLDSGKDCRGRYRSPTGKEYDWQGSGHAVHDPFPSEQTADRIIDGEVIWQEASGIRPALTSSATFWEPNHGRYNPGEVVCVSRDNNDGIPSDDAVAKLSTELKATLRDQLTLALSSTSHNNDLITKLRADLQSILGVRQVGVSPNATRSIFTGPCTDIRGNIRNELDKNKYHLHYYFAVKGGKSGDIPQDPFSVQFLPRVIYLPWTYLLPGDVIPTFNVNLVYTPPTPGAPWQGNTFYPAGSVVTPGTSDGHYYTALTGGFSAAEPHEPKFSDISADPDKNRVQDGALEWLDWGTSAPTVPSSPGTGSNQGGTVSGAGQGGQGAGQPGGGSAGKPQVWFPFTHYLLGDVIYRPESGHYFTVATIHYGISGASPASQPSNNAPQSNSQFRDPFPSSIAPPAVSLTDNEIGWTLASPQCPTCSTKCDTCPAWSAGQTYSIDGQDNTANEVNISDSAYVMTTSTRTSGSSGTAEPKFPSSPDSSAVVVDQQIEWRFAPGASSSEAWHASNPNKSQTYSVGWAVCDPAYFDSAKKYCTQGHTFVVDRVLVGTSGSSLPSSQSVPNTPLTVTDGDLLWEAIGTAFDHSKLVPWKPLTQFNIGDVVQAQSKQYYQMVRYMGGVSGGNERPFSITHYCTAIDPVVKIKEVRPGTAVWQDMGTLRPRQTVDCSEFATNYGKNDTTFANWQNLLPKAQPGNLATVSNQKVDPGLIIYEPGVEGGRYYKAFSGGTLGPVSPFTNITPPMLITWLDSGTTPPASVSSGQPADQTVSLINLTLPQTHTLARFNIAAGAELTFARPPSFGWVVPTAAGVNLPTSGATVTTSSGSTTYYFVPASAITTGSSQSPIPTTVPTAGASSSSVAVEPRSECTYGLTALQDTSPYSKNPNVANASPAAPVPVYAVYECPLRTGAGPRPIDAVLAVTAYLLPVDEEIPWQWEFWKPSAWRGWVPAPSFGMSLTNPTGNFYLGGSNEFGVRNLQLFYGRAFLNQQATVAPAVSQAVWGGQATPPTVATTATVRQGWYLGATFNLSNFVQSIIGGGGAK